MFSRLGFTGQQKRKSPLVFSISPPGNASPTVPVKFRPCVADDAEILELWVALVQERLSATHRFRSSAPHPPAPGLVTGQTPTNSSLENQYSHATSTKDAFAPPKPRRLQSPFPSRHAEVTTTHCERLYTPSGADRTLSLDLVSDVIWEPRFILTRASTQL